MGRVAELWFDSRAAREAAWSSDVGRASVNRLVLITEEHEIIE